MLKSASGISFCRPPASTSWSLSNVRIIDRDGTDETNNLRTCSLQYQVVPRRLQYGILTSRDITLARLISLADVTKKGNSPSISQSSHGFLDLLMGLLSHDCAIVKRTKSSSITKFLTSLIDFINHHSLKPRRACGGFDFLQ